MRPTLMLFALLLACSAEPTPPSGPANDPPPPPPPPVTTTPEAPTKAEAPPATLDPLTCSSDVDCDLCETRTGCNCLLADTTQANEQCGPMTDRCLVAPCSGKSASCANSKCVLRHAPAGRCEADSDCEVRDDDCRCDLFAALKSAPASTQCAGQSCGARPAKSQWQARCDKAALRCVLERAPS